MIIATLVFVFGAVLCLGAAFSGLLWYVNRNKLYRSQFFLWLWAIVSFVLQGAFQNLEMSGFLAYSVNGLSLLAMLSILNESFDLKIDLKKKIAMIVASVFVSSICFKLRLPFVLSAMPFSLTISGLLFYTALVDLKPKRAAVARGFAFLLFLNGLHFLDYPFIRPRPEFAVAGFAIALCFYFTYAVFIPLTLTKIMGDRYSSQLEAKVRARTKTLQTANTKLEMLQEDLTAQYQNLQALVEDNRILMSVLVHDIATPLSVMDGSLTMLESAVETESGKKNLARIGRGISNLKQLTERAKADHAQRLGKITLPGNISTAKPKVDLAAPHPTQIERAAGNGVSNVLPFVTGLKAFALEQAVRETIDNYEESLSKKGLTIQVQNLANQEIQALGDEQHLKLQVLGNLISNAIKFSHTGGTILISIEVEKSSVILRVKDNGVGVPENMVDEIFANNTPTTSIGTNGEVGTGLGLPIVRHFARKMGGDVRLLSRDENTPGACFEVKLKRPA